MESEDTPHEEGGLTPTSRIAGQVAACTVLLAKGASGAEIWPKLHLLNLTPAGLQLPRGGALLQVSFQILNIKREFSVARSRRQRGLGFKS